MLARDTREDSNQGGSKPMRVNGERLDFLLQLVYYKRDVIEDRSTARDTEDNMLRRLAWKEIAVEFNNKYKKQVLFTPKTASQLAVVYKKRKCAFRVEMAKRLKESPDALTTIDFEDIRVRAEMGGAFANELFCLMLYEKAQNEMNGVRDDEKQSSYLDMTSAEVKDEDIFDDVGIVDQTSSTLHCGSVKEDYINDSMGDSPAAEASTLPLFPREIKEEEDYDSCDSITEVFSSSQAESQAPAIVNPARKRLILDPRMEHPRAKRPAFEDGNDSAHSDSISKPASPIMVFTPSRTRVSDLNAEEQIVRNIHVNSPTRERVAEANTRGSRDGSMQPRTVTSEPVKATTDCSIDEQCKIESLRAAKALANTAEALERITTIQLRLMEKMEKILDNRSTARLTE